MTATNEAVCLQQPMPVPSNPVNFDPALPVVRFPPFPPVPPGVTIKPFKEFKEWGILMFGNRDDVELDGLGVPTVELRVVHDTDEYKTEARIKRKKKQQQIDPSTGVKVPALKKEWWEQWEDAEDLRNTGIYNTYVSTHSLVLIRGG